MVQKGFAEVLKRDRQPVSATFWLNKKLSIAMDNRLIAFTVHGACVGRVRKARRARVAPRDDVRQKNGLRSDHVRQTLTYTSSIEIVAGRASSS